MKADMSERDARGGIPFDETPHATIARSCTILDQMHGGPTLSGARTLDLTRDILAASAELEAAAALSASLLEEALVDLQAAQA